MNSEIHTVLGKGAAFLQDSMEIAHEMAALNDEDDLSSQGDMHERVPSRVTSGAGVGSSRDGLDMGSGEPRCPDIAAGSVAGVVSIDGESASAPETDQDAPESLTSAAVVEDAYACDAGVPGAEQQEGLPGSDSEVVAEAAKDREGGENRSVGEKQRQAAAVEASFAASAELHTSGRIPAHHLERLVGSVEGALGPPVAQVWPKRFGPFRVPLRLNNTNCFHRVFMRTLRNGFANRL